jgi:hypothetical protein
MNGLKQLCKCGHHKDTHFEKEASCLGMHCECKRFVDETDEPVPSTQRTHSWSWHVDPKKNKPHINMECRCTLCLDWWSFNMGGP